MPVNAGWALLAGLVPGLLIAWALGIRYHRRLDALRTDLAAREVEHATLDERTAQLARLNEKLEHRLSDRDSTIEALNSEISERKSMLAELEARMQEERKAAGEKLTLLDEAKAALREHLLHLKELNRQMSEDALSLTHALKGESKAQGNWGEMILERLLTASGLREGHEFAREQSFTDESGRRLRPDVVVYMPGDKQVIVDSKVSLTDYERAVSATDDGQRKVAVKAHLRSLRQHIQELAGKRYDHLPNVHSPDYVLMFVPIEGAYLMAIEADQSIFENAFEQRIAVVTPSTLYATLRLIEQLWRYERQNESVAKLIERAGRLHDKMADFVKAFEEVGERLGQARKAYDTAHGRISSGRGNVMSQVHELGRLAGKTRKELPAHLVEAAVTADRENHSDE